MIEEIREQSRMMRGPALSVSVAFFLLLAVSIGRLATGQWTAWMIAALVLAVLMIPVSIGGLLRIYWRYRR